jgi:hypothetical protein
MDSRDPDMNDEVAMTPTVINKHQIVIITRREYELYSKWMRPKDVQKASQRVRLP